MPTRIRRTLWLVALLLSLPLALNAQDQAQQITDDNGNKQFARISRDGGTVAYVGAVVPEDAANGCVAITDDNQALFWGPSDGAGDPQVLVEGVGPIESPSLSANGRRIAFARRAAPAPPSEDGQGGGGDEPSGPEQEPVPAPSDDDPFAVFVLDVGGSQGPVQISQIDPEAETPQDARHPMLSADGATVVYEQGGDIYAAPADGSGGPENLTQSPEFLDHSPTIGDNGAQIAFSSDGDYLGTNADGDEEIFVMTSLGAGRRQLTNNAVPDRHPWISGDAAWVAFEREFNGQVDVFVVPADGSAAAFDLTSTPGEDETFPSLNTDGAVVAFQTGSEGNVHYAQMNRDGSERVRLSKAASPALEGVNIVLSGDGSRAAFAAQEGATLCRQVFVSGAQPNGPPLADGGGDQTVQVGATVQLDASNSSDPDDDVLGFAWAFVQKPEGSEATLDEPNSAAPSFVADVEGEYLLDLTVSDGREGTDADKVRVTATPEAPDEPGDPGDPGDGNGDASIETALDENDNDIIDDAEMARAIELWVLGDPVPGTDGRVIDDDKIFELIALWVQGAPIGGSAEAPQRV